jgi:hypothetical protein
VIKAKRLRWVGLVACTGERRSTYKVLVVKRERNRPLERPRCSWENNIKIYVKERGREALLGFIWLRIGRSGGLL